ncbi:hypothetical protein ACFWUP_06365 [Nocardia sp. NPDC058658]|uniref:hypothetical protein n=1 Tax=Nocardia sp. NPDC058658 TaxID=3346580 RepID=UPI00364A94E8
MHAAPAEFIAPQQPGVIVPPTQPGVTTPAQPAATAPPPMEYVSPEADKLGVAPETDYLPTRQIPEREYVAPLQLEELHAPEPERPVAPIVVDPRVLRAGDLITPAPEFLDQGMVDQFNAAGAGPEAQISQFARSVGVAPSRADKIAAGAVGGAVRGATIGCVVPAAFATATIIGAPLAPLNCVAWGAVGLAAGGLIGAGTGGLQ